MGITSGALGNQLIFDGSTDSVPSEVWHSGGTSATTSLLKDINPTEGSFPTNFTTVGSYCYFIANSGADGYQIYRTDGAAVTRVTKLAGTTYDVLRDLTNFNGTLFFTYVKPGQRRLLYKFDGTDLALVGSTSGPTNPGYLTPVGKNLYFSALDTAGKARLYQTDGTTISLVTGDAGTDPAALVNVNGTLYFQASDAAHGGELRAVPGAAEAQPKFRVTLGASATTIDEGGKITYTVTVSPKGSYKYEWDFDGDGALDGDKKKDNAPVVTHLYPDNFEKGKNATRSVRVKVTNLADGSTSTGTIGVTVKNVKPKLKFTVSPLFSQHVPFPFFGSVTDKGVNDQPTITIEWDNGVTETLKPAKDGTFGGIHSFDTLGAQIVIVTARDKDGGKSSTVRPVLVRQVLALPKTAAESKDAAIKALNLFGTFIGGSAGNNKVNVQPSKKQPAGGGHQALDVTVDGVVSRVVIQIKSRINVFLGKGNDRASFGDGIKASVLARGGGGKDIFYLGNSPETVLGDAGNDHIFNARDDDTVKA